MTRPILRANLRKAELSFAYIVALAARDGFTVQRGPAHDVDSIDVTIRCGDEKREALDLQLKATARPDVKRDGLHFRLKRKNYNDLVIDRSVPMRLVVLELPPSESQWLSCTPDRLVLRKCAWWFSLVGQDPIEATSKTVVIPSTQRIDSSGLDPLFQSIEVTQ